MSNIRSLRSTVPSPTSSPSSTSHNDYGPSTEWSQTVHFRRALRKSLHWSTSHRSAPSASGAVARQQLSWRSPQLKQYLYCWKSRSSGKRQPLVLKPTVVSLHGMIPSHNSPACLEEGKISSYIV